MRFINLTEMVRKWILPMKIRDEQYANVLVGLNLTKDSVNQLI